MTPEGSELSTDTMVVGAGVVGLAVGRALALTGRQVIVVERHSHPGTETSSRNSGVIHSGIYYAPESVKARLCVQGRERLYDYCEQKGIAHRRCGKLLVAQSTEIRQLDEIQRRALDSGVEDLVRIDAAQIARLEPEIRAAEGLLCPSTGIIDPHELMTALHGDIEHEGGSVVFNTEVLAVKNAPQGFSVDVRTATETSTIECRQIVNAAGLMAIDFLRRIEPYARERIPLTRFAKGNYFSYVGKSPFLHLVYPIPGEAGLGVHATLDLGGALRFGPDVEWLAGGNPDFDYEVRPERASTFYEAIREYWPGLPSGSLAPAYAGIRPKLVGIGEPAADFRIEGPAQHGVPGLFNLLGIESPGLTASLAIGDYVREALQG